MLPEYDIEGKHIAIIGAGRGIGKGIALTLAEAGADVAVVGLTPSGVNQVANIISGMGRNACAFLGDAIREEEVDRLAGQILDYFGSVDVLVNCVGGGVTSAVVPVPGKADRGMTQAEWQSVIDLNLTSAFLGCRAFGAHFLERRSGSIINLSSISALQAGPYHAATDAAKAGLTLLTSSLALEWAPFGVRVNAIAPSVFPDTDQASPESYQRSQEWARRNVPLGRVGQPREVGLLALYLASDASAYVTGQTFLIDGGLSLATARAAMFTR